MGGNLSSDAGEYDNVVTASPFLKTTSSSVACGSGSNPTAFLSVEGGRGDLFMRKPSPSLSKEGRQGGTAC